MDYEELTEVPVVFPPGVSAQTVTLTTIVDAVAEGDETLTANITTTQSRVDIVNAPQTSVTVTIVDSYGMFCIPVSWCRLYKQF